MIKFNNKENYLIDNKKKYDKLTLSLILHIFIYD